jgi:hypothetical protein
VGRWRWVDSELATFARPSGPRCTIEQYELGDLDDLDRTIAQLTAMPAAAGATRWLAAYRQVFPRSGAYRGAR